jgi:succinate dehydrogenase / fumarate reductase cytochrome b subunit
MSTTATAKQSYIFGSSIGKKFVMGLTGLFLISFLLVHCFINSMVFFDPTGALFNDYAHFMGSNILIRIAEVGLFVGLIIHIADGLLLWKENINARPEKYKHNQPAANSTWYSRSMGLLGTLLLFFLIVHLIHFWVPSRFTGLEESAVPGIHDLYAEMVNVFANPAVVLIYVLSQISLAYHLLHGFSSAFQSLGLNHVKYNGVIKNAGVAFSIGIPAIFALMPIVIYLRH